MATKENYDQVYKLINEYLTDGVITERERKAILRKAERLDLDVEEIDLYIDAQVQKLQKKNGGIIAPPIPVATKSKTHVCPSCGANLPEITDKCPYCDSYISPTASRELDELINKLEEALVELKSTTNFSRSMANIERYTRKARLYYSNNPKIKDLLKDIETEVPIAKGKAQRRIIWNWICKHPVLVAFILLVVITFVVSCFSKEGGIITGFLGFFVFIGFVASRE